MTTIPKQTGDKFFPGMGEQYEVALENVGISVVDCTVVAMNATAMTDANLIAAPPNTDAGVNAAGPIVHSLGTAPALAILQPKGASMGTGTHAIFVTADNSALYFRVKSWTQDALGYAVRAVAIR